MSGVELDYLSKCPLCKQPLDMSRVQEHLEAFHLGQGTVWQCGQCRFSGLSFNEIGSHCVNFEHSARAIQRGRDKDAELIQSLAEVQDALSSTSALPAPKTTVKTEAPDESSSVDAVSATHELVREQGLEPSPQPAKKPYAPPTSSPYYPSAYPYNFFPFPPYQNFRPDPTSTPIRRSPFQYEGPSTIVATPMTPVPIRYGMQLDYSMSQFEPTSEPEAAPEPVTMPEPAPSPEENSIDCPDCNVALAVNMVEGKFRYSLVEEHVETEHLGTLKPAPFACAECPERVGSQGAARRHAKLAHGNGKPMGAFTVHEKYEALALAEIQRLFPALEDRFPAFRLRYRRLLPPPSQSQSPPSQESRPLPPPSPPSNPSTQPPPTPPASSPEFKEPRPPSKPSPRGRVAGGSKSDLQRNVVCGGCQREVAAFDGKGFRKDALMSHLEKSHTEEPGFKCAACDFSCRWRRECQIHTKAEHGTISQEAILLRGEVMEHMLALVPTFFPTLQGAAEAIRAGYEGNTTILPASGAVKPALKKPALPKPAPKPAPKSVRWSGEAEKKSEVCVGCGVVVEVAGPGVQTTSVLLEHVELNHMGGKQIYGCSLCSERFTSHPQFSTHSKVAHKQPCSLAELLKMVTPDIQAKVRVHFPSAQFQP